MVMHPLNNAIIYFKYKDSINSALSIFSASLLLRTVIVNHTWPLSNGGGDRKRRRHLSVQLARGHSQAERRLPAQRPGNQQTFVLHLLQTHHHLLGGTDARVKSPRITSKRLRWRFLVITKQTRNIFFQLENNSLIFHGGKCRQSLQEFKIIL